MSNLGRRDVILGAGALALASTAQPAAAALDTNSAKALIGQVVGEIYGIINSGRSEGAMLRDFEGIFSRYGDLPIIARSTLGADARRATPAQLRAYSDAFGTYLAHKYGRRFREFIGSNVAVQRARQVKRWYEVDTVTTLRGQAPILVVYKVSDRSGKNLFFDIVIEGISLGKSERTEIGAMLDRRRGDLDLLIQDLRALG